MTRLQAIPLGGLLGGCSEPTAPPGTGAIAVTTTTNGQSPDLDGYTVALTGGAERVIDANGKTAFTGLEKGNYQVTLGGVADNCAVGGLNPRAIAVTPGATVTVNFTVVCWQAAASRSPPRREAR